MQEALLILSRVVGPRPPHSHAKVKQVLLRGVLVHATFIIRGGRSLTSVLPRSFHFVFTRWFYSSTARTYSLSLWFSHAIIFLYLWFLSLACNYLSLWFSHAIISLYEISSWNGLGQSKV